MGARSPFGRWRYAHYDGIVAKAVWLWFGSSLSGLAEKRKRAAESPHYGVKLNDDRLADCGNRRRAGVSRAEVVMDDMAIGNPVSPVAQLLALLSLVPRHP